MSAFLGKEVDQSRVQVVCQLATHSEAVDERALPGFGLHLCLFKDPTEVVKVIEAGIRVKNCPNNDLHFCLLLLGVNLHARAVLVDVLLQAGNYLALQNFRFGRDLTLLDLFPFAHQVAGQCFCPLRGQAQNALEALCKFLESNAAVKCGLALSEDEVFKVVEAHVIYLASSLQQEETLFDFFVLWRQKHFLCFGLLIFP